ncbi:MAG: T9SS type A sorting domain-containing protein [Cryomorphaceae bacterium]
MTRRVTKGIAFLALASATIVCTVWSFTREPVEAKKEETNGEVLHEGRWEYLYSRLVDPRTGEIPANIRMREMAFASRLPKADVLRDSIAVDFKSIGPYNVGGRTRAIAIDRMNPDTYIVGGVTGGVWRTSDAGQSWTRVSKSMDHPATSYIIQDPRSGKNETWYYGSGETIGNSASKSFSALYRGSGIWKSTDNGLTWNHLQHTASLQHKSSDWEVVHSMCMDPTRNDSDVVFAAIKKGIVRSNDGGTTWKYVLKTGSSADFTRVASTSDGVFYASISNDASSNRGFWRSDNGLDWVLISPNGLAGSHDRTVIAVAPSDENIVFFYSYAPGAGYNSAILWRYKYLSGDGTGAGGEWQNRTSGLASSSINMQGGYNMVLGVKPDDEDVVFLGATNLIRSTNAFADTFQVTQIGGYAIDGDTLYNYFVGGGKHYPDQQNLAFRPDDPDVLISTTDAGVHRAQNCMLDTMEWVGLLNGYNVTQFYGIAIDEKTTGSEVVIGGTQDRGSHWTDQADAEHLWSHVRGADGAYCDIEDGAGHYYISTQYANIERCKIDNTGEKYAAENIMPKQLGRGSGSGWLFVHPFTLDKANNEIMYLPNEGTIWRNTNITETDSTTLFSDWRQIANLGSRITAIASSPSDEGVVYAGTTNGRIFRLDSAHTFSSPQPIPASDSIKNGGYTSCIAVHPNDPMKAIAVFSNYNCRSMWYTEDGGGNWMDIEGNLAGEPDPGVPESLWFIGNGPSIRWATIVPTGANEDVYFIGTSVGVFSTAKLEGEATEWVMQGSQTIGNAVVDMLKYRTTDGWLVAGSHGKGMYAGHVSLIDTTMPPVPEGIGQRENASSVSVFPNPTSGAVTLRLEGFESGAVAVVVYDQVGRSVKHQSCAWSPNNPQFSLDLTGLQPGTYFVEIRQTDNWLMEPVVIR